MSGLVAVIAGGEWQAPIIEKLQSQGFQVLNINYYSDTRGAIIADIFEKADVIDKAECLRIAQEYNPVAVLTDQSDIAVPTVAYIAEKLGLPGIGSECARLFTNKLAMREEAKRLGIYCPEYGAARSIEEAKYIANTIGYPVIVKSIDSQSSRGVIIVKDADDLAPAVDIAFSFSNSDECILVEQYIDGMEWTVEGYQEAEGHMSLAVSHKEHFEGSPTVASSLIYEPIEYESKHQQLIEQNNRLIEGFKLPFGISHAEYKYYEGKYYLIEVAARGGGTKISSHIIPIMSGVDVNELLIESAVGKTVSNIKHTATGKHVILSFLEFEPGKVRAFTPVDEIMSFSHVIDFKYNFDIGGIIEVVEDDRSRHAHVIISADSPDALHMNLEKVRSAVTVDYE